MNNVIIKSLGINCTNCNIDVSGGNVYTDTPTNNNISNIVPTTQWVSDYISGLTGIPIGGIIMWAGGVTSIPVGWALCDGTNGIPDLSGKFILGYQSPTYLIGATGGQAQVTLNINEIPAHNHSINDTGHSHQYSTFQGSGHEESDTNQNQQSCVRQINTTNNTTLNTTGITINNTGGSGAHDNMPPYYVLAYIMRIN